MTIIGELAVLITGRTEKFERSMKRSTQITKRFSSSMKSMLAAAGVGGGIGFGIRLAAQAEKAQIAFEVLLKSSDKATATMKELKEFAAKTPFQFADIQKGAKSLLAAQVPAAQLTKNLRMLGDIAAITDLNIGDLAVTFGKMKSGQLIQGEELNMLAERSLPIYEELAKVLGTTPDKIRKLGSEGKITFADLTKAFQNLTSEGGAFFGATDRLAGSAAGKWSTLTDNIKDGFRQLGEAFLDELDLKSFTDDLTAFVSVLTKNAIPAITVALQKLVKVGTLIGDLLGGTISDKNDKFVLGGKTVDPRGENGEAVALERFRQQNPEGFAANPELQKRLLDVQEAEWAAWFKKTAPEQAKPASAAEAQAKSEAEKMAELRRNAQGERFMARVNLGAATLGNMFGKGSNFIGDTLNRIGIGRAPDMDKKDGGGPLGINTAVTAGSAEAIRLAARAQQQQHPLEAIQTSQLEEQRGMRSLMGTLVNYFTGAGGNDPFDTTGALY